MTVFTFILKNGKKRHTTLCESSDELLQNKNSQESDMYNQNRVHEVM